jgi:hypothetical protein
MSPEHLDAFSGDDLTASAVDARSDVYSLGVLLYELFTGEMPFDPPGKGRMTDEVRKLAEQRRTSVPLLAKYVRAPASLERVIARCLAPDPADRFQSAAELAAALESCRELERVRRDMPQGSWLTRAALARPFLIAAVLVALPHVLGSVVNITYNSLRIHLPHPEQKAAFLWVMLGYNVALYPACLWLFFRQWLLVYRVWRRLARPGWIDPDEVDEARLRSLRLAPWAWALSAVGWLPGGLAFPLLIDLIAGGVEWLTYFRFVFSFTMSGLVALTYTVIGVRFVTVRVLYPGLWLDARKLRQVAPGELAREEGGMRVSQLLAVLIPLMGASLLLGVTKGADDLGFRLLVIAMMAAGAAGTGLAIYAASELRRAVDAITGRRAR